MLVSHLDLEDEVPVATFACAVMALLVVAHEAGREGLSPWIDRLRCHLLVRVAAVPGTLRSPFAPRLRYRVFEARGSGVAVADILSDGRSGRVIAHQREAGRLVARIAAEPLCVAPPQAHPVGDAAGRRGDPAPVLLPSFRRDTLRRLASEALPRHGFRAERL